MSISSIEGQIERPISETQRFCNRANDILHSVLEVPDPNDRECRFSRLLGGAAVLRVAFTVGDNEYPGTSHPSFNPTPDAINRVGKIIAIDARESKVGVSEVIIEPWENTTFLTLDNAGDEPPQIPKIPEYLQTIDNPRLLVVVSPKVKLSTDILVAADKLSNDYREMFNKYVTLHVVQADAADSGVSVEFDCDTPGGVLIPETIRQYMAQQAVHAFGECDRVGDDTVEAWIRQGKPSSVSFRT